MLSLYSFTKRYAIHWAITVLAVLAFCSCEKFEKKAENSSFTMRAQASQTSSSRACLELNITEGSVKGDCTSTFDVYDSAGKNYSGYVVYFSDGSIVQAGSSWSFTDDGKMSFTLGGLSPGGYKIIVCVRRWYHTASVECDLIIE